MKLTSVRAAVCNNVIISQSLVLQCCRCGRVGVCFFMNESVMQCVVTHASLNRVCTKAVIKSTPVASKKMNCALS